MKIISKIRLNKIKKQLVKYSMLAYEKKLTSAAGGNISQKLNNDSILISATNCCMRNIHLDELVFMNNEGSCLSKNTKLSKEYGLHLAIYKNISGVNAIIHLHPPFTTAWSVLGEVPLVTLSAELKIKKTYVIESAPPGSNELINFLTTAIKENKIKSPGIIILKNHGSIAFGKNIEEVYNLSELLEDTAKIAYIQHVLTKNT